MEAYTGNRSGLSFPDDMSTSEPPSNAPPVFFHGEMAQQQQQQHHDSYSTPYLTQNSPGLSLNSTSTLNSQRAVTPASRAVIGIVNPLFIDKLGRRFVLHASQVQDLHKMATVAAGLEGRITASDLATRLYSACFQLRAENHLASLIESQVLDDSDSDKTNLKGLLQELQIRLDDTFKLTREQRKNARRISQDLIYDATRTSFKTLHIDVENKLRGNVDLYRLNNVVGIPSREVELTSGVKRISSNVRNIFRQDIKKSVIGRKATSLSEFTVQMSVKYRQAVMSDRARRALIIHNALLRRFALDNQGALNEAEDEEASEPNSDSDEDAALTSGKKRKRAKPNAPRSKGRVANGEDFWSKVDAWFAKHIEAFGGSVDLTGEALSSFVQDTIARDNCKFDPQQPRARSNGGSPTAQPVASTSTATAQAPNGGSASGSPAASHVSSPDDFDGIDDLIGSA